MTTGSILLGFALLILVVLFLAQPFLRAPERESGRSRSDARQALLAQKEAILAQIRSLDFDHETGKMPDEVYQPQRAQLVAAAAAVLQQAESGEWEVESRTGVEAEIEAAVSRLRQGRSTAGQGNGKGGFCPQCGQPTDVGDRFCAACGHRLSGRQPAMSET
jgi:hypothetical protein